MLAAAIVVLLLAALALFWSGRLPPPHAATLIRIQGDRLELRRGHLEVQAREHVAEILRDAGVSRGYVAITPGNRVIFSRQIPPGVHQRLRNILVNQWS